MPSVIDGALGVFVEDVRDIARIHDVLGRLAPDVPGIAGMRHFYSNGLALVHDGTLAPIVETDGYFGAIISFRQLLGL